MRAVGSAKDEASEKLAPNMRKLTSIKGTRALGSAKAKAAVQLGPFRPKTDKQRSHDGRRVA